MVETLSLAHSARLARPAGDFVGSARTTIDFNRPEPGAGKGPEQGSFGHRLRQPTNRPGTAGFQPAWLKFTLLSRGNSWVGRADRDDVPLPERAHILSTPANGPVIAPADRCPRRRAIRAI